MSKQQSTDVSVDFMVPEAQAKTSLASLMLKGLYWLRAWTGRPGRDLMLAQSCATPDSLTELDLHYAQACEQKCTTYHICISLSIHQLVFSRMTAMPTLDMLSCDGVRLYLVAAANTPQRNNSNTATVSCLGVLCRFIFPPRPFPGIPKVHLSPVHQLVLRLSTIAATARPCCTL